MAFLELEYGTPSVYTEESRDFQLLLRLYNSAYNSVLNDVELIQYITDNKRVKAELLELEKSRLGYDTNLKISDNMLRSILVGFPELLKNKGSIKGIIEATNLFLKTLNIKADIVIYYSGNGISVEKYSDEHTVIIGIGEVVTNYYILEDLMRYILPAGFGISFFFFKDFNKYDWIRDLTTSEILLVGDKYADSIRYNFYDSSKSYVVNDIVIYENKAYRCLVDNSGKTPPSQPTYWEFDEAVNKILTAVNTLGVYSGDNDQATDTANKETLSDEEGYLV